MDAATNRYTSVGGNTLDYDNAGNLTTDRDGYAYTYDCENRIVRITDDQQALIAEYDYDALGRRIRSYDALAETTTLYYYSDGWQVIAEHDGSSFTNEYVYGNDVTEPLVVHDGANDYFYLHDHLYSTVALVNSAGAVVERYEYDAYGKVSILSPNYELRTTSSLANPYLFAGYRFDANTGLYHTLYRSYDPYTGRWLQHDPLGYADSMSLYEYVMSNPINHVDPYGDTLSEVTNMSDSHCVPCYSIYILYSCSASSSCNTQCQTDSPVQYGLSKYEKLLSDYERRYRGWLQASYLPNGVQLCSCPPPTPPSDWELRTSFLEDAGYSPWQAKFLVGFTNITGTRSWIDAKASFDINRYRPLDPLERGVAWTLGGLDSGLRATAVVCTTSSMCRSSATCSSNVQRVNGPRSGCEIIDTNLNPSTGVYEPVLNGCSTSALATQSGQLALPPAPSCLALPAGPCVLDITARLQCHVDTAVKQVDSLGINAFTPGQQAAIQRNPCLQPMFRGNRIDRMTRGFVEDDLFFKSFIEGKCNSGPDFLCPSVCPGVWWDMTTSGQWQRHLNQYGSGGIHLCTDPQ